MAKHVSNGSRRGGRHTHLHIPHSGRSSSLLTSYSGGHGLRGSGCFYDHHHQAQCNHQVMVVVVMMILGVVVLVDHDADRGDDHGGIPGGHRRDSRACGRSDCQGGGHVYLGGTFLDISIFLNSIHNPKVENLFHTVGRCTE